MHKDFPSGGQTRFDYIIAGAGCAGLSLAIHLVRSGKFDDKKILLLDREPKRANDRTWCFWEKDEGIFEPIVYKQWERLWFYGEEYEGLLSTIPYKYKMIRGIDFYNYCLRELANYPNVSIYFEKIDQIFSDAGGTGVIVDGERIESEYVFNSILFEKPVLKSNQYWMLQHFRGWIIETDHDVFDPEVATLMDFRVEQQQGTAFVYVLPFHSKRALVEYTVFSSELLSEEAYEERLRSYINDVLKINECRIIAKESGVIPMTNADFPATNNRIIHIGTAGGQTKGSSGYTFQFIQKHCRMLTETLARTGKPGLVTPARRFHFYDSVLLNVLFYNRVPGKKIFTDLFRKNKTDNVLRFLDNESSPRDELRIIASLPKIPFMKAAMKQLF